MKSSRATMSLFSYTVVHFMVDFVCLHYLMGTFTLYKYTGIGTAKGFLLYNAIAFGMQFIIGRYYDNHKYGNAGIIGVLMIMTGVVLDYLLPYLCEDALVIELHTIYGIQYKDWLVIILVLLGLGNAFFHVAGGMDSLLHSNGKMKRCGIFVSTGALGVAFGSFTGANALIEQISLIGMLFFGFSLLIVYGYVEPKKRMEQAKETRENPKLLLPALLCFFAIVLRGYLGTLLNASFQVLFLAAIATCFGKLMGGILADEFGGKGTGFLSLVIAAICFSGWMSGTLFQIIGIVCFNLAMPITYYTLYECFPLHPGFACGLNCLGLLGGVILPIFIHIPEKKEPIVIVVGSVIAALLLLLSAPKKEKQGQQIPMGKLRGEEAR